MIDSDSTLRPRGPVILPAVPALEPAEPAVRARARRRLHRSPRRRPFRRGQRRRAAAAAATGRAATSGPASVAPAASLAARASTPRPGARLNVTLLGESDAMDATEATVGVGESSSSSRSRSMPARSASPRAPSSLPCPSSSCATTRWLDLVRIDMYELERFMPSTPSWSLETWWSAADASATGAAPCAVSCACSERFTSSSCAMRARYDCSFSRAFADRVLTARSALEGVEVAVHRRHGLTTVARDLSGGALPARSARTRALHAGAISAALDANRITPSEKLGSRAESRERAAPDADEIEENPEAALFRGRARTGWITVNMGPLPATHGLRTFCFCG